MADRTVYNSSSPGPITGPDYMDQIAEKIGILFNAICLVPTSIVNSSNDYELTIDPTLTGDVVSGMGFYITPNANNTGAVRMRITSGGTYYDVLNASGEALESGAFNTLSKYFVVFIAGSFYILSVSSTLNSGGGAVLERKVFNASGTWTKPTGLSNAALVIVECWGGGGAGGQTGSPNGGGGGGAYVFRLMRGGDFASTVTVTIGAGGATTGADGNPGGNTSFGSHVTAYGGGGNAGADGGGGGGNASAGSGATPGGLVQGSFGGGIGGSGTNGGNSYYGGGGGGQGSSGNGGNSYFGGGGGGGASGAGGVSIVGGGGGADGVAGTAPAGGGGRFAAGAAGRCIVRVIG